MQTITHRVRTFLAREGVAIEPWTGLAETYGELYGLLWRRRDDPSFWTPLEALLRAVIEHATDPDTTVRLAAPEAELLTNQDVDELVQAMREALPPKEAPAGALPLRAFTGQLSPAVLGGFLLFGFVAAGCGDPAPNEDAATTGGAAGSPPATGGQTAESGGALPTGGYASGGTGGLGDTGGTGGTDGCALPNAPTVAAAINDPAVTPTYNQSTLCTCLNAIDQSWTDGLAALFENATASEIAAQLRQMVECCRTGDASGAYPGYIPYCMVAPAYKGVSFQSRP